MPRRARLDTPTVVRAAAELINADGLDALSLARLAERLDVQTPSLYNHIDGLPGLYRELALLSTRALGERLGNAAIGKSGPQAVRALADAYRAYIKESPGVYMAGLRSAAIGKHKDKELAAAQARVVEIVAAVVESFGLRDQDALHAVRGLRSVVHGFATLEVAGGFGLPLDCDESFRRVVDTLIRGLAALATYQQEFFLEIKQDPHPTASQSWDAKCHHRDCAHGHRCGCARINSRAISVNYKLREFSKIRYKSMEPNNPSLQPVPNHRTRNTILIIIAVVIILVIVGILATVCIFILQLLNIITSGSELL